MATRPMAHLTTVGGLFHARVLAARLGAEGILTELRGAVGATYPLGGEVHVFVDPDQADAGRQLLLADQVDAALAPAPDPPGPSLGRRTWGRLAWTLVAVLVGLYVLALVG